MTNSTTTRPRNARVARFDRSLLPPAETFFRRNLSKFRARGNRGTALCPFHRDHHPSLSVDLGRGLYHCFTCGAAGDVISFVMQRDGLDFKGACISLGVWRNEELSRTERFEMLRARKRRTEIDNMAVDLAQCEHDLRMHYRNTIHAVEHAVREMRNKLRVFIADEVDEHEYEACVVALNIALDKRREAVVAYYLLSFATVGERVDFVLHPEGRAQAIADVMSRGFVRDDAGHLVEVEFYE